MVRMRIGSPTLVSFKDELTTRILTARDVAATCPKARFTDSRLHGFWGIPERQTSPVTQQYFTFG
jgi:hypothetical protein